ncbi:alpha-N-acetylgalactosaminidase-like [Anthonomus grandis grandis]|uniref:alpha-N-acetylgalactosaminidase-like n=1 Tax=Anthonomus grandis grandis TaxID=2921223 RepID=UPI0021667F57|nr:alpha-N-acetylgalactosaminidase-like [Anthonomus grandis grandis]
MKALAILLFALLSLRSFQGLDNGLARTPPMGWLSWERFRCLTDCQKFPNECISETLFKRTADKMVSDGYLAAGYEYIIIDDCWSDKSGRDSDNRLKADPIRFPNGIKPLADYVHNLGLQLGIYGDYGTLTCGGYPGSLDYLELDAQTFAEWGVDYLKLDGCYVSTEGMEEGYALMAQYLNNTGRPIAFSCSFPAYKGLEANYSMAVEHCNLWRNYGDIDDSWEDVRDIATWFADNQDFLRPFAGPGHWNDPDMLIIGNFGLSLEQSKSQMTMWAIMASPLIMSVDLDTIKPEFKAILQNEHAIRINQDPLGVPGKLVSKDSSIMVWSKPLQSSGTSEELALGLVSNRTDGYLYPYDVSLANYIQSTSGDYKVIDVFDSDNEINERSFKYSDNITVRIPPTGAVLLLISSL